ncbi:MAG: TlpA disulfide reductase family protein [Leptospirales bacterium]
MTTRNFLRMGACCTIAVGLLALLLFSPDRAFALSGSEKASLENLGFIVFDDQELAPDLNGPELSGNSLSLSSYRGKWVLLNFWATWCVPCRTEIPTLNKLGDQMKKEPFLLISVAMDYNIAKVRGFVQKIPVGYPVILGRKGKIDDRYFGMGLPQTYLIDPRGILVGKVSGSRDWDTPESQALFRELMASPSPPSLPHHHKESS